MKAIFFSLSMIFFSCNILFNNYLSAKEKTIYCNFPFPEGTKVDLSWDGNKITSCKFNAKEELAFGALKGKKGRLNLIGTSFITTTQRLKSDKFDIPSGCLVFFSASDFSIKSVNCHKDELRIIFDNLAFYKQIVVSNNKVLSGRLAQSAVFFGTEWPPQSYLTDMGTDHAIITAGDDIIINKKNYKKGTTFHFRDGVLKEILGPDDVY